MKHVGDQIKDKFDKLSEELYHLKLKYETSCKEINKLKSETEFLKAQLDGKEIKLKVSTNSYQQSIPSGVMNSFLGPTKVLLELSKRKSACEAKKTSFGLEKSHQNQTSETT